MRERWWRWFDSSSTFSISSIHASRSMPKSIKAHSMPSLVYSSCSRTNIWWLKNCWSFSFVKLMQSCSKLLNCSRAKGNKVIRSFTDFVLATGLCLLYFVLSDFHWHLVDERHIFVRNRSFLCLNGVVIAFVFSEDILHALHVALKWLSMGLALVRR